MRAGKVALMQRLRTGQVGKFRSSSVSSRSQRWSARLLFQFGRILRDTH